MAIHEITEEEFHSCEIDSSPMASMIGEERSWFEETESKLLGTVINDKFDKDWSYVILAIQEDGHYRGVDLEVSIDTQEEAEARLQQKLIELANAGEFQEELYVEHIEVDKQTQAIAIIDINEEVKQFFKRYPEKLHELSPRKFEELVASILQDMGLKDIVLTQATRDGGSDIIAHIKNELTSLLILVECKRYAPDNKVGVGIVREVAGVHDLRKAAKSIIVTTSTFTKDAIETAKKFEGKLDLKDYDNLKDWLKRY